MLDIKFIRENAELVAEGAKKKHIEFDVQKLIEVDDKRKAISLKLDLREESKQNEASQKIPQTVRHRKKKSINKKDACLLKKRCKNWKKSLRG